MFDIDAALRRVVEGEGSDLHVKVPSPPMVRIHGALQPLPGADPLTPEDTEHAFREIVQDDKVLAEFDRSGEADFSYSVAGLSRFRVNAFRQRGSVAIACRAIPYQVRSVEDLGLPPVITKLAEESRGIVLLTGTTGSGKSTTLAAMVDHINSTRSRNIITLEDPIEYLHRDKKSIISQREVGMDTESFAKAMRRILRQDPDVILIGEMRDEETVRTALSAAETGHLVLSTLHTLDATETVNRIIDFFPPHLQQQARVMLAATLRGVVGQRLVKRKGSEGRVAVCEVLVATGRVEDLILNPKETGRLTEVIAEGEYYGMQTYDQALLGHVLAGNIDEELAMDVASSPTDFRLMLDSKGQRSSGIEQLDDEPEPPTEPPDQPPPEPATAPLYSG
ncbi:MAG: type IV pilus twitching motility protein PilT [Vicinamibacteria bacterium]|jgi:twitching motility protein PilT